jgi:hypothetical protein
LFSSEKIRNISVGLTGSFDASGVSVLKKHFKKAPRAVGMRPKKEKAMMG